MSNGSNSGRQITKEFFYRIPIFLCSLLLVAVFMLGFSGMPRSNRALANSYTWDGEGDTASCGAGHENYWSCAKNWTTDVVPVSGDTVTFDGTSSKNSVIDGGFGSSITQINMSAGYGGILSSQTDFTITTLTEAAGTFTITSGAMTITTLNLQNGTFNASSGTMTVMTFNKTGGTFNHNNGSLVILVNLNPQIETMGDGTEFYDLTFTSTNSSSSSSPTANVSNNFTVTHNLNIQNDGKGGFAIYGGAPPWPTITVQGDLIFPATAGTGSTTLGTSGGNRFPINLVGNLTLNESNTTLNGNITFNGTGTQTITQGSSVVNSGTLTIANSSGSVVQGGNLALTVNVTLSITTGNYSAGNYNLDLHAPFNQSGGSFTAPSGTMTVRNSFTRTSGTFTHNNGTVSIDVYERTVNFSAGGAIFNIITAKYRYNFAGRILTFNSSLTANYLRVWNEVDATFVINGGGSPTLTINNDVITETNASLGYVDLGDAASFTINLAGNLTANDDVYYFANFVFNGPGTQTVSYLPNASTNNTWTINKSSGSVQMLGANVLNNLTISSGTFDPNGNNITVNGNFNQTNGSISLGSTQFSAKRTFNHSGGTFDPQNGTVVFTATAANQPITSGGMIFNNITFAGGGSGGWILQDDLVVGGDFSLSSGSLDVTASNRSITVGGNFAHSGGTFYRQLGTVYFNDAAKTSVISGSTTFTNVSCTTPGKHLTFTAGTTQLIMGALTLTGSVSDKIVLRSSADGNAWTINPANKNVSFVDVKDSTNTNAVNITALNSLNSGSNVKWNFPSYVPVLSVSAATGIGRNGATLNGAIVEDGNEVLMSCGFQYGLSEIGVDTWNVPANQACVVGPIDGTLSGLDAGTTYYYRSYAANSSGPSYSTVLSFTTSFPTISISASPTSISENGGTSTITVTLSEVSGTNATVDLAFAGTATKDTHYTMSVTSLTVTAGSTTATSTLTATNNLLDAADRSAQISLTNPVNTSTAAPVSVTVNLTDDDYTVTTTFDAAKINLSPVGPAVAQGGTSPEFTYSAKAGYQVNQVLVDSVVTAAPASYTFSNISANHTIEVTAIPAVAPTLSVSLASAIGRNVATANGSISDDGNGTITNWGFQYGPSVPAITTWSINYTGTQGEGDYSGSMVGLTAGTQYYYRAYATNTFGTSYSDTQSFTTLNPTVSIGASSTSISEKAGTATITVALSEVSNTASSVDISLTGTAVNDTDYSIGATSITLDPGETSATTVLSALPNTLDEANKIVHLALSNPINTSLGSPSELDVTLLDDDFTITTTIDSSQLNITPTSPVVVESGSDQHFVFTPKSGFAISSVLVDGEVVTDAALNYTFSNITQNHTLEVKTGPVSVIVDAPATAPETISLPPAQVAVANHPIERFTIALTYNPEQVDMAPSDSIIVIKGSRAQFSLLPRAGYEIEDVLVDGVSQGPITAFTFSNVMENHSLRVVARSNQAVATQEPIVQQQPIHESNPTILEAIPEQIHHAADQIVETAQTIGIPEEQAKRDISAAAIVTLLLTLIAAPLANAATLLSAQELVKNSVSFFPSMLGPLFGKKREWGRIVEVGSKVPLPQVKVSLYYIESLDQPGKLIVQAYTNQQGEYGFVVEPGQYQIHLEKDDYEYIGDQSILNITVASNRDGLVVRDLEMSPTADGIGHRARAVTSLGLAEKIAQPISLIFLIFGTILVLDSVRFGFNPVVVGSLVMYVLLWAYNIKSLIRKSPWGKVIDSFGSKPISLALVRVFDRKKGKLVRSAVTGNKGDFSMLIDQGDYQVMAVKPGYKQELPLEMKVSRHLRAVNHVIKLQGKG